MSLTPEPTGVAQGAFFLAGRLDTPRRAHERDTEQAAAARAVLHGRWAAPSGRKAHQDPRERGSGKARNASNRRAFDVRTQLLHFGKQDTDACAQRGDTLDGGKARITATRANVK